MLEGQEVGELGAVRVAEQHHAGAASRGKNAVLHGVS
jgi:hypothetical protein